MQLRCCFSEQTRLLPRCNLSGVRCQRTYIYEDLGKLNLKSQCDVHICYTHVYPHDFEYKHHIFIMSVNYIQIAAVILPASTQPPLVTSSIPTARMTSTGIETEPSTTIEVI